MRLQDEQRFVALITSAPNAYRWWVDEDKHSIVVSNELACALGVVVPEMGARILLEAIAHPADLARVNRLANPNRPKELSLASADVRLRFGGRHWLSARFATDGGSPPRGWAFLMAGPSFSPLGKPSAVTTAMTTYSVDGGVGVWDWTRDKGSVYISHQLMELLELDASEQVASLSSWVHRIDERYRREFVRHVREVMRKRGDMFRQELRFVIHAASYWLELRARLSYDSRGRLLRIVGTAADFTSARQTVEMLEDRTEQLKAVFLLSPDAFLTFGRDYRVNSVNPAFEKLLGYELDAILGISEERLIQLINNLCAPQRDLGGCKRFADVRLGTDGRCVIEKEIPERRVLGVNVLQTQSALIPLVLSLRDITHETVVEEMKSAFLATAAHELRTPMTSVLGFAELLASHRPMREEDRKDSLESIVSEARRLSDILDELLDLSKMESRGARLFDMRNFDLQRVILAVLDNFQIPAGREKPELRIFSAVCRIDEGKAHQAILNILSNAYKYSETGAVKVSMSAIQGPERLVEVAISDEGIGISARDQQMLFQRFFRVDRSGSIPGSGLGLSIVREIMNRLGGTVSIESQLGVGTTVRLRFLSGDSG